MESSIFKSGLRRKTLLLTGLLMLAVITIQFALASMFLSAAFDQDIAYMKLGFDTNIKTAVETVASALKANHKQYLDGLISEEAAVLNAKRIVRDTRYSSGAAGKTDDGYFWADMADGLCVVHYNPDNEGAMRWEAQDREGVHYIQEFIRQGDAGGGYSDFYFGKPGDERGSHRKRGYTLKFEPYGWYISTGNYYEDIDELISEVEALKRADFTMLSGVSLVTVIVGLFLVSINLNHVVSPIIDISRRVQRLSKGDTSAGSFSFAAKDEIGDLQSSIMKVVRIIHGLLENINTMISEQRRGNIDYRFDTEEFLGDYKILADSVLELASVGMLDQLTGIPNRRSFDNRLHLEWKRALRDKTPISILMMDIDKFKKYNDTFGHQQGDLTLQAVAMAIKQSLKRSVDFSARWGGEEFVVLLQNTDAKGAMIVAEKIRLAIENTEIPCADAKGKRATVSIGTCTQIPLADSTIDDFVSQADHALYQAKEAGRNRTCQAQ
jgi:diguanylate cyclase (GGDEF)-like protein